MESVKNVAFLKKLLISIGVILLYFLWPTIIKIPFQILPIDFENLSIIGQISYQLLCSVLLIVLLFVIYRKSLHDNIRGFVIEWKRFGKTIVKGVLMTVIVVFLFNGLKMLLLKDSSLLENDLAIYQTYKEVPWLLWFMTIVYYPIVEELVFSKTVRDVISHKWLFVFVSSIFFWYFNFAYIGITVLSITTSFVHFLMAFIRTLIYYKTDNICVPICIKMIYNALVSLISL